MFFSFLAYTSLILILFVIFLIVVSYFFDKIAPINEHKKVCIVTGASSGIGLEIAKQMVKKGWKVIGIARREEKLKEAAQLMGQLFTYYVCDVKDQLRVTEVCEDIKKQKLEPTLFFLGAGISPLDIKFNFSKKNHEDIFATNYFGIIKWIEKWLPEVKNYGGATFVGISSAFSLFSIPGFASYSASKAAIKLCFQSLRLQYFNDKIGFCTVLPGPVDTAILTVQGLQALPFKHKPEAEAAYIVKKTFKRCKQIEPSWFYACLMRVANFLPDKLVLKIQNWLV